MLSSEDLCELSKVAIEAALKAGALIQSYTGEEVNHLFKEGGSSEASQIFTEVDLKSQEIIIETLKRSQTKFDFALLAEESKDDGLRHHKQAFWCIDPLDGTLPFTEGKHGYSVVISLISKNGIPLIGLVYDPVKDELFHAIKGQGLYKNQKPWDPSLEEQNNTFHLICDRSFYEKGDYDRARKFIEQLSSKLGCDKLEIIRHGGGAMNAIWTLSKKYACYFKYPKTKLGGGSIWDFAASACLFNEAKKPATNIHGKPLDLNRTDSTFMNHEGILFSSNEEISRAIQSFAVSLL